MPLLGGDYKRIVAKLKVWGQGLFNAVFSDATAQRLFNAFQDAADEGRQITIAASQPEILRLPWELLCDPSGTYLVHENPRIAVRRQLAGAGGGRKSVEVKPKAQLRLLMVVSRPDGVGFIDPRSEAQAVLQAILKMRGSANEQTAPGRVVVEFLRPATLTKLVERLEHKKLPAIDIVHFDGHGVFDGGLGVGKSDDGLTKGSQSQGMGYLVFEDEDGKKKLVSADDLGDALNRQQVSLMVLSACQSAMVTGADALGCVAARLTHSGIPAVLAMTYSVLVTTTEQLFGKFYGELAGGGSLGVALANARRDLYMRKRRGLRWRGTEQIELELSDWFLPAWYQAGGDITLLKKAKTLPPIESPKHRLPELAEEGFFGRSRELWQIERAFVQGTQRLTIAGFGGQGKTYLAVEAGRWLSQTGMFDVVAYQLKERRVGDLARSLEELLAAEPLGDKQRCLVASLNLSLERLDADLLAVLPRLGVFQGGAFEHHILYVTEISPEQWADLKSALVRTGLVQIEETEKPFLRFHPSLAPFLWRRISTDEKEDLRRRHQDLYYVLVSCLYDLDAQKPERVRLVFKRELPNLFLAVNGALDNQDENAVTFVDRINKFLDNFGLKRDREFLTKRLEPFIGEIGSDNWFLVLSNQGEQLYNAGKYAAAVEVFSDILQKSSAEPSLNRINTLISLERCFEDQGQLAKAEECLRVGIGLSEQLEQSDRVKRQQGMLQTALGNLLTQLGQYLPARHAYEDSLKSYQEIGDCAVEVVETQLGTLAMLQGDLTTAVQKYQSALQSLQQLQEARAKAVVWHQLGRAYEEGTQWAAAEQAYRISASIKEQQGNLTGAATTYGQLAMLSAKINKPTEAEDWYHKALQNFRLSGDRLGEFRQLNNLANLLSNQHNHLPTAQKLAKDALAIAQTLDPAATEIWKTYNLLATISTAQGETDTAKEYRQLARTVLADFAGTQYALQQREPLIAAVVDAAVQSHLEPILTQGIEIGRGQIVAAIRRVLAGEREVEVLWDDLDLDDSMIIAAILGRV